MRFFTIILRKFLENFCRIVWKSCEYFWQFFENILNSFEIFWIFLKVFPHPEKILAMPMPGPPTKPTPIKCSPTEPKSCRRPCPSLRWEMFPITLISIHFTILFWKIRQLRWPQLLELSKFIYFCFPKSCLQFHREIRKAFHYLSKRTNFSSTWKNGKMEYFCLQTVIVHWFCWKCLKPPVSRGSAHWNTYLATPF